MFRALFLAVFAALICITGPAQAAQKGFDVWLKELKTEARGRGVSEKTIRIALPDTLKPIERVIQLDRKQPEKTKTFEEYLTSVVNDARIKKGRVRYGDHKSLLYEVGANYGVDPQYIVALWGIETNFGQNTGGYDVVTALATLAYDGRRGKYFRDELIKALQIIDNGHIKHGDMKGSWAGAMGQTQFMPSSFFNFAEDYNRDGRRDIWTQKEDVFASAANYLSKSGWKHGEPWGRRVDLPKNFDKSLLGTDSKHTLQFWHDKGVRLLNGRSVPFEGAYQASVIQPDGPGTQAYIVYDNYCVIMKWNRSTYFATAVGLLADSIKG
ncbi:MAG: lytic murein transglycosylase [Alphaproteobacteria bacterium]|nr:lytic murein transglycosylase [Alphaproteobacteria bacterium]